MGAMGGSRVVHEIEQLDPARDFERISFLSTNVDFPWDVEKSLDLAFFKTYATPSISALLDRTGEFRRRGQKRYDDTRLILAEMLDHGIAGERGTTAQRLMNRMHGRFPIANEDYLYVLSALILEPLRWNDRFGWRPYTSNERLAHFNFWCAIGRRMGIRDLPPTLDELERFNVTYERDRFRYADSNRAVADATLRVFVRWYPAPLRPLVDLFVRALLEDAVLDAFGYRRPARWARALVFAALRVRAAVLRRAPRRRRPHLITEDRIRSYPHGYRVEELGTLSHAHPADG
jgi:ER-bound oxygenase mpaB/B'/Rubber oxygenase, catalytic domain